MKKILYTELVGEMAKHGDTEQSIADLLGMTYSSVSRRLAGRTQWNIDEIDKLCEYYDKNYYELFKKND